MLQMLHEPDARAAILEDMRQFQEAPSVNLMGQPQYKNPAGVILPSWMLDGTMIYPWTATYEPGQDTMIANVAARTGRGALELCYDSLLDVEGAHAGVLWRPLFGYTGNNDMIAQGLSLPNVIPGFDDAGAHCTILTDATCATSNISYCECRPHSRRGV
jgi:N-acyl-D-aspartate/D-glutamate deacylase